MALDQQGILECSVCQVLEHAASDINSEESLLMIERKVKYVKWCRWPSIGTAPEFLL